MNRHKEQRVGVFIDVQNMYYSAKQLYSAKVNFISILKEGVAGRKLIRAMAYVIKADVGEEQHFFDALEKIGFDVRMKPLQIFFGGAKKGDWDVGIAMDVIRMASKLDTVVLVSGDGDFQELLEYVKATGCRAEVMAFGKTTSSKLKDEADLFIDMDKNTRKYLIGGKSRGPSPRRTSPKTAPKPTAKTVQTTAIPKAGAAPKDVKDAETTKQPTVIETSANSGKAAPDLTKKEQPRLEMPSAPNVEIQKNIEIAKKVPIKKKLQETKQAEEKQTEKKPVEKKNPLKKMVLKKLGIKED